MSKVFSFFGEVKSELMKVIWPTRAQTLQYTAAIILFSVVMAIILGAVDLGLLQIFEKLLAK
jgi:preprotein translocase subunit SecE